MEFVLTQRSGEHEIFAENAFDHLIGQRVPVNLKETDEGPVIAPVGHALLVGAAVVENGKAVKLTLKLLADENFRAQITADLLLKQMGDMSFRFT
jgi:hypothetical protein